MTENRWGCKFLGQEICKNLLLYSPRCPIVFCLMPNLQSPIPLLPVVDPVVALGTVVDIDLGIVVVGPKIAVVLVDLEVFAALGGRFVVLTSWKDVAVAVAVAVDEVDDIASLTFAGADYMGVESVLFVHNFVGILN